MQRAESNSLAAAKPRLRLGWFAVAGGAGIAAWFAVHVLGPDRALQRSVEGAPRAHVSPQELQELKASVQLLDRKSSALAAMVAASERAAPSAETAPAAPAPAVEDKRSRLEKHREVLAGLDAALVTDEGDLRERRASAEALRRELAAATGDAARVLGVECATAFCKAVLEQDTTVHPPMDMNALIAAAPFLKRESMFGYQKDPGRKRTTIYAAREGHWLPLPGRVNGEEPGEGYPLPDDAPAAEDSAG